MAQKPLRPCRHPGCGTLTREGWCPQHKPREAPRSPEAAAWRRWYSLKIWTEDLRPGQLLREPFCRACAARGIRTQATDVDHIRDHKGDWELFTDWSNLQSLCHSCHSRKTMLDQWKKRRKNSCGRV